MRSLFATIAMMIGVAALPGSAQAACSIDKFLDMPVTMAGLRPMVPAQINGHDVKFIADSGAFYSSISPGSAAELSLKLTPAPFGFFMKGIGGDANASIATVKDFGLGPSVLHKVQFLVGGSEVGGIGLLGQNFLGLDDAEYDLAHGAIRLMKPKGCDRSANLAYWAGATTPVSQLDIESVTTARFHTSGIVYLDGVRIRATFDTGAPLSILTRAAAARAGIKPDSPGVVSAGQTGGIGRHTGQSWIGGFQSLRIGDEEIKKIRLRFGDLGDVDFDMLIGADFFLSHHIYVANSVHKLFFTYNGGPVFDLTVHKAEAPAIADAPAAASAGVTTPGAAGEPKTAEEYSRRGAALSAQLDFAHALPDLTRAVELAPDNATYRYQRAVALARSGQRPAALADLDHALVLSPADPEALLMRAQLRLAGGNRDGARADLASLSHAVAAPSNLRLQISAMYDRLGDTDAAIAQLDQWIPAHPDDSRMPEALNDRCWARATTGQDLDQAIADCDRALKLRPHTASYLDSRGLARLRKGDADKALADFDAALALNPRLALSLYGRGLIEANKGEKAKGDADMAAAIALEPKIGIRAKKFGLPVPSGS